MENLSEQLNRIKELMLYEAFDEPSQERIIKKYVDQIITKRIGEPFFYRFFKGKENETYIKFTESLINKIKEGEYGNNFSEVQKNLKYLNQKRLGAVLAITEKFYEEKELPEEELNELKEKALMGNFCRDCTNRDQVNNKLEKIIKQKEVQSTQKNKKTNKKLSKKQKRALKVLARHGSKGEEILARYGIYGKDSLSMGDYTVRISLDDPKFIEKIKIPKGKKEIKTTYDAEEDVLIWRTPNNVDERYDYAFNIGATPEVGKHGKVEVLRKPLGGSKFKEFVGETKITIKKVDR